MRLWRLTPLGLLCCALATGCVTPQAVKDASTARLQLADSLDAATVSFQRGLDEYEIEKRELIRNQGRVLVAQMAIYEVLAKPGLADRATFDTVFNESKTGIRKYIDDALRTSETEGVDPNIAEVSRRLAAIPDTVENAPERDVLKGRLDDLRLRRVELAGKPDNIKNLEAVILSDLQDLAAYGEQLRFITTRLRSESAVIKGAAATVDRWLQTDVTITQDQVDGLTKTYTDLIKQLNEPTPATKPSMKPSMKPSTTSGSPQ